MFTGIDLFGKYDRYYISKILIVIMIQALIFYAILKKNPFEKRVIKTGSFFAKNYTIFNENI